MRDSRVTTACAAALLAAVLTGCAAADAIPAEPKPKATAVAASQEPSPSSIPIPPAGVEPVDRPRRTEHPQIDSPGLEGAIATLHFSVRAEHYALATGDRSVFQSLSAPGCRGCAQLTEAVRRSTQEDEVFVGGGEPRLEDVSISSAAADGQTVTLRFRVARDAHVWWNENGIVRRIPAMKTSHVMVLGHRDGQWWIVDAWNA